MGDLVRFGQNRKGIVYPSLRTANTLGLTPRAAHFSQNWCNLAPTGRFGTTGGNL